MPRRSRSTPPRLPEAPTPDSEIFSNALLNAMSEKILARLGPKLMGVTIPRGTILHTLDEPIQHVHFVTRGLVSLVKTMRDGRTVEIGAIGRNGVTGVNALFGIKTALFESIMQIPGDARRIDVMDLRQIMEKEPDLHRLMEAYVHVLAAQIAQTAACNRLHSTDERCSRWLLTCHDAAATDTFQLTQEFLSMMLGVRRASVTNTARDLQNAGLIAYRTGRITILDRSKLEARACECYETIRALSDKLVSGRKET